MLALLVVFSFGAPSASATHSAILHHHHHPHPHLHPHPHPRRPRRRRRRRRRVVSLTVFSFLFRPGGAECRAERLFTLAPHSRSSPRVPSGEVPFVNISNSAPNGIAKVTGLLPTAPLAGNGPVCAPTLTCGQVNRARARSSDRQSHGGENKTKQSKNN